MADFREVLQKTINAFLDNNTQAVKTKDASLLSAILTNDCIRSYRPLSFVNRYPQVLKPHLTNEDYETHMRIDFEYMKDVSQNISRTVIDTTQRAAVIWTEQTITMADGSKKVIEIIWDLSFTEDGGRVSRVVEFVDTYESTKVLEQVLGNAVRYSVL